MRETLNYAIFRDKNWPVFFPGFLNICKAIFIYRLSGLSVKGKLNYYRIYTNVNKDYQTHNFSIWSAFIKVLVWLASNDDFIDKRLLKRDASFFAGWNLKSIYIVSLDLDSILF